MNGCVEERTRIRILVVDDDAVACEFLEEVLTMEGYEVRSFTSASEFLRHDLSSYDLLISLL